MAAAIFIVILALELAVGALVGAGKNRTGQSIALVLMLGPIGLLLIVLARPRPTAPVVPARRPKPAKVTFTQAERDYMAAHAPGRGITR